jgi:hypothetical protein
MYGMLNMEQVVIGLKRGDFGEAATERRRPCEPTPVRLVAERDPLGSDPLGVEALIVNVSKSGIGMRLDRRIMPGTKVRVETSAITVTGIIRYCVNNLDKGWFDLGFEIGSPA